MHKQWTDSDIISALRMSRSVLQARKHLRLSASSLRRRRLQNPEVELAAQAATNRSRLPRLSGET